MSENGTGRSAVLAPWAIVLVLVVGVGGGFAAQGLLHGVAATVGVVVALVVAFALAFALRRRPQ